MMFKIVDGKLDSKSQILSVKQFAKDLSQHLENKEYSKVLIFAVNGNFYLSVLLQQPLRAIELQVLLRKPTNMSILNPKDPAQIAQFHNRCKACLEDIQALATHGNIKKVTVRYYDFDSLLHFMVVDNELIHYGLLLPNQKNSGTDVLPSRVETDNYKEGRVAISQLTQFFNSIFASCSESCLALSSDVTNPQVTPAESGARAAGTPKRRTRP